MLKNLVKFSIYLSNLNRIFPVLNEQFTSLKYLLFGHYSSHLISFYTEQFVPDQISQLPKPHYLILEMSKVKQLRCQCYKTFSFFHLRRGLISQMVCPWKPFPVRPQNLWVRPEPTQLEDIADAFFLGKLLVLPANVRLDWKVIARYKHSSLFGLIISNEGKKFYNIQTGWFNQRLGHCILGLE